MSHFFCWLSSTCCCYLTVRWFGFLGRGSFSALPGWCQPMSWGQVEGQGQEQGCASDFAFLHPIFLFVLCVGFQMTLRWSLLLFPVLVLG